MGCCCCKSGTPAGFNADAGALRAAKHYFELGELPVSVRAAQKAGCIEVTAVGLAQMGLLAALEEGFTKRQFWISDGTTSVRKGLFVGAFKIKPIDQEKSVSEYDLEQVLSEPCEVDIHHLDAIALSEAEPDAYIKDYIDSSLKRTDQVPSHLGTMQLETPKNFGLMHVPTQIVKSHEGGLDLSLENRVDTRTLTPAQLAKVDAEARNDGATLRLTILHQWAPGLRHALTQSINSFGFRIIAARLSLARSSQHRTIKDTFWLAPSGTEGICRSPTAASVKSFRRARRAETNVEDLPMSPAKSWRQSQLAQLLSMLSEESIELGPATWNSEFECPSLAGRNISADLQSAASSVSADLPQVLLGLARSLPYDLHPALEVGEEFEGASKFVGAGMNTTMLEQEHVLEFSTYMVPAKPGVGTSNSWLSSLLQLSTYAEFVTQYHPTSRRLTIFKAFLNSIVAPGKKAGARAVAEQLITVPVAGALDSWDGAGAIQQLQEIYLCDVVNWNTYLLLSKAGKGSESDTECWLLEQELTVSGLTLAILKTKAIEDIFAKTALGKLVNGILGIWSQKGIARHSITGVKVIVQPERHEMIFGEYRSVMDVVITLATKGGMDTGDPQLASM